MPNKFSFASIGSGSKGNGTLVVYRNTRLLVDCGFSLKETEVRLATRSLAPDQLSAILVTHEHSDHISGVSALSRKYGLPVYLTAGTWRSGRAGELANRHLISSHEAFGIGDLHIQPVAVPHDAREPVQYVFRTEGYKLGVLTDLGSITAHVADAYADCDALLLEANHCEKMLAQGPYPATLKERVGGSWGHLSNEQSARLLRHMAKPLRHLVLAHLSEQNNHPSKVEAHLRPWLSLAERVTFACQQKGFDWLVIDAE